MLHISYDRVLNLLELKTDFTKEQLEEKIQAKLKEFSGLLSPEGAAHIVANELGVDISDTSREPLKIAELAANLQKISLTCKVLQVYDLRTFMRNEKEGQVQSLLVGDETGVIRITFWHGETEKLKEVKAEESFIISNLSVRKNNNRLEMYATKDTEFSEAPHEVIVKKPKAEFVKIKDLTPNDTVKLFGYIVQIIPPYFYPIEKETRRRARVDEEHPFDEEKHEWNVVCNTVIDDGTETVRVACFGEHAADLLDISMDELFTIRESPDKFVEFMQQKLAKPIVIQGRVSENKQYERIEIVANEIVSNPDVEEIKKLNI